MKQLFYPLSALFLAATGTMNVSAQYEATHGDYLPNNNRHEIVSTDAYRWIGDSILQGEFKAYAPNAHEIVSTYSAYPHYFMPVSKHWKQKNDISTYPSLSGSNTLLQAVYNMGLDEMINAVEPDTTLRTGKEWAGVWTRDVSYSIILSMSYMQPEAAMISLRKKVNRNNCIIQDTGSGGAWPVSSDRMIWSVAAYEIYKVTGDRKWLEYAYPIIRNSFEDDFKTIYGVTEGEPKLVKGETSFIDWREQSYPRWMQTADIYRSEAMGTNVVHAAGLNILADMARILGKTADAKRYKERADQLSAEINNCFYMPDKGYYAMYRYGRNYPILNPREETLGESLAILYGVADETKARSITENVPVTPYGPAIFYPQISDMPAYHNNALWPFVASYWALANAKAGNEQGTLQAIGSVIRPAALFATNKENFNLDNGDIQTELNSSNMLWSLSGNIALTTRILFGIHFEEDGLLFAPMVPQTLADSRILSNFPYRGASLNIRVNGYGDSVKSISLNDKALEPGAVIPAKLLKGECNIDIEMSDSFAEDLSVNNVRNLKAPLTPIAWIEMDNAKGTPVLAWNPIEYIAGYKVLKNGVEVAKTRQTTYSLREGEEGEWQVIGFDSNGVESFASEPRRLGRQIIYQMPDESTTLASHEISYLPKERVAGYHGSGFVETDHDKSLIAVPVNMSNGGRYSLQLRYANGNGPVNTENKCAIRSILVDGVKAGTVVMPQRGVANWNDWGLSNVLKLTLPEGASTITIRLNAEDENMNIDTNHAIIDQLILTPLD
jgi:hypothetical protein